MKKHYIILLIISCLSSISINGLLAQSLISYQPILASAPKKQTYFQTFSDTIAGLEASTASALKSIIPAFDTKIDSHKAYPVALRLSDDELAVRQSKELCPQELNFIKNRTPQVAQALKKYFDIDAPLKIGMCFSGGGNRAMLVSLGFLLGAQDIGLFDASYYMAGLSGSTWTILPFSYLHATQQISLTQFKDQLVSRLNSIMTPARNGMPQTPIITQHQMNYMQNTVSKRFASGQYVSSIDIYGSFIGDFTLLPVGENRLDVTFSSIAKSLEQGSIPLPLGSAVADKPLTKKDYFWFEVGPFEVGSDDLGAYVPIQGFGLQYKQGKVVSSHAGHAPEYPLSFYEGVFGSAFTISMQDLNRVPFMQDQMNLFNKFLNFSFMNPFTNFDTSSLMSDDAMKNIRLFPACFHNYTLGLKDSPLAQETKLKLYDAGLGFDLPLPLMMRQARDIDVIIACDSMIDLETLQLAAVHFKQNNIKFPDVSSLTEQTISKLVTVLNDPRLENYDNDMITIVYCPFIKNNTYSETFDPIQCRVEGFCGMFNFNYTKEQAEEVVGLTRYNVNAIKNEIKAVLQALQEKNFKVAHVEVQQLL